MATTETVRDRRQARDERGIRSTASAKAAADRLPSPPRERKPALAALAILLIVGGAAVAGLLAMRVDERVPVIAANQEIPVGTQITAEMLATARVAADSESLIPASQADDLVGRYAKVDIAPNQLFDTNLLSEEGWLSDGRVAVSAALEAGRVPASGGGLRPGDIVQLIRVDDEGDGEVIVDRAQVGSSLAGETAGTAGAGAATVTFVLDESEAATVAAVAAQNQLSVVLVSRGGTLEGKE